ncbi:hypothetical protein [Streptomyces sp. NPDC050546]|uniref:hypothetical protein n=1 Tax=Streptomyces sp. NPDC050546 TaxID=3365628 RepID=UPI003795F64D
MGERRGSRARRPRTGPRWTPVLLLGTLALLPATAGQAAADTGRSDVRLVYCLADEHRGELGDAAVRLGVVRRAPGPAGGTDAVRVPGREGGVMSLDAWAGKRTDDFERVCDAVMAAAGDPPGASADKGGGGLGGFTDGALLLVTGAVLTVLGQKTERISAERRTHGRQLTAAVLEFRRIAWLYLAEYEQVAETDHAEVARARATLTGLLALVPGPAARRAAARALAGSLPLADGLPRIRDGRLLQPQDRKNEADTVRTTLDRQTREVGELLRPAPVWWLRGSRHSGRPTSSGGQHG